MATPLIDFKDAVNAAELDPAATAAVYYADGAFTNRAAVAARCPHAKLYAITVTGLTGVGIFACDSENGDLTVAQTISWVAEQVRLNVSLIVVYANLDRWENQGLLSALSKYGSRIKRWVADFTDVPAIPAWADAEQYATGAVDLDVARANFFQGVTPAPQPKPKPKPKPKPASGVAHFDGTFNLTTGEWTIHGLPGIVHWGTDEQWDSAELQICRGGARKGKWRIKGIPVNAKPLGD